MSSEVEHLVTVTATELGSPKVEFTCSAAHDAWCHTYPDPEFWDGSGVGDQLEPKQQAECWLVSLFENSDGYRYVGDDSLGIDGAAGVPNVDRSGPIVAHLVDEWIEWEFVE